MQTDEKKDSAQQDADLWIQALTYFKNIENDSVKRDMYIKKSLDEIAKKNILSPLLVLEILGTQKDIKFEVISDFLTTKLKE